MNGATPLEGLYAAGEAACVSINGANRLGSNSLTELLVFGARAGRAAADYASTAKDSTPAVVAQAKDEQRRLDRDFLRKEGGHERLATLRVEMQKTMETSAGIYRTGDALARGVDQLRSLQDRMCTVSLDDRIRDLEANLIGWALKASHGNKSRAAELLQIKRSTLGDRINRCGLGRGERPGAPEHTASSTGVTP